MTPWIAALATEVMRSGVLRPDAKVFAHRGREGFASTESPSTVACVAPAEGKQLRSPHPSFRMAQMDGVEQAMIVAVKFPEMRLEVIGALESLSDVNHQRTRWGHYDAASNYYDDLTMNVNLLYDCRVLPNPADAAPEVIRQTEVAALTAVKDALEPMIDDLGDRADAAYMSDPRWPAVVRAAAAAVAVLRSEEGS